MSTLDKDRLQGLIDALQLAKRFGFSSLSSPMEPLLESATDLLLLISRDLEIGKMDLRKNPQIRFDDFSQDALGNPKQITTEYRRKSFWDPPAARFLKAVASSLIQVRNHQKVDWTLIVQSLPSGFQNVRKPPKELAKIKRQAKVDEDLFRINAYYRRQRTKNRPYKHKISQN